MQPTTRFRIPNRVEPDEETQDPNPNPHRRPKTSRGSNRTQPANRSWLQMIYRCPRGPKHMMVIVFLCAMTFYTLQVVVRARSVSSIPELIDPNILGPNSIPSTVLIEKRLPADGKMRNHGPGRVCRNTEQGMILLADSEGRVCPRTERGVLRSGCCTKTIRSIGKVPSKTNAPSIRGNGGDAEGTRLARAPHREDDSESTSKQQPAVSDLASSEPIFPPPEEMFVPFSCWSCNQDSSCCRLYEFCVSCCLDPRHEEEREAIRAAAALGGHPVYNFKRAESHGKQQGLEWQLDRTSQSEKVFDYCAFRCRTYSGSLTHENSYRGPLKHCFGRYRPPVERGMSPNSDGSTRAKSSIVKNMANTVIAASGQQAEPLLELDPYLANMADR